MAAATVPISSDAKADDVKENETWRKVVGRNASKENALPMFILEREILTKEKALANPIKEEELYFSLIHEINSNHMRSVQTVREYIYSK